MTWGMRVPMLYFFPYLHQTTTDMRHVRVPDGCISFLIYIKPQRRAQADVRGQRCISFLIYIKPQRWRGASVEPVGCISFLIYIKPQREPSK